MIVIPELRSALPADALAPKAPANVLAAIQDYLQARTPKSAKVRVRNATFQPVRIRLGVRFREGLDEPFCRQRLNQDLVRYLSPWAYSEASEVRFGNTIFATSIVDFADRLDYVDYVGNISMALLDPDGMPTSKPADGLGAIIQAPGPSVVLVSAVEHQFDQINDRAVNLPSFSGIGYMQIGFDFVIASTSLQEARASP